MGSAVLALDPAPCTGGGTTCDALQALLPVLTMAHSHNHLPPPLDDDARARGAPPAARACSDKLVDS